MTTYAEAVRFLAAAFLVALWSCSKVPPAEPEKPDPTKEPWFAQTVAELTALNREAEALMKQRKSAAAGRLIEKGQALMARLLAVPRPTLEAMQAASDLDELYGRMLLANRHYGWARLQFQKNVARWKNWRPETADTVRRREEAEFLLADVDQRLENPVTTRPKRESRKREE